jgi:hypothetical protein
MRADEEISPRISEYLYDAFLTLWMISVSIVHMSTRRSEKTTRKSTALDDTERARASGFSCLPRILLHNVFLAYRYCGLRWTSAPAVRISTRSSDTTTHRQDTSRLNPTTPSKQPEKARSCLSQCLPSIPAAPHMFLSRIYTADWHIGIQILSLSQW